MSLFNAFMGGDFDDDPIFGLQSRAMNQMNAMMSSVMSDAFGGMMGGMDPFGGFPSLLGGPMMGPMGSQMIPHANHRRQNPAGIMSPFGMLQGIQSNGGLSFSSSSMTSMTIGPDGQPQVYQATSSTRSAPGGIKETKKTVSDSRSGVKKMAVGHHIGERAHIIERKQNVRTGQREEHVELVNLSEDEAEEFDEEWKSATRGHIRATSSQPRRIAHYGGVTIEDVTEEPQQQLALPAPSPTTGPTSQRNKHPKKSPSSSVRHDRPKKRDHGSSSTSSSRAAKQHRSKHNY